MKRCHHCGGQFGLVRHRHFGLNFCTARCLEIWKLAQFDKARQHRFLEWLLPSAASLPALPASTPARNYTRGGFNRVVPTSSQMR
jgi:hypothetical protein